MVKAQEIANAICKRVKESQVVNFAAWRIGITNDVKERYEYWGKPEHFLYWKADSLSDAQTVESHFINKKGMQGGTGGDLDPRKPVYVYIF
ncbi:MAG: hypothetical protein AB1700_15715 [Bacillota bacterium]